MKKVLFVATVDSHIELFHLPYLKYFKEQGYKTYVATNSNKSVKYCDKKIQLPITRSPFRLKNIKAIKKLRRIINAEQFDIIHCHTPMGGVVARLAARQARRIGARVIYTAHGFHFYKGAPLYYWLMFYPVEKYLAKYTDTLITINDEDYRLAKKKFSKRCKQIEYVPGVGVDKAKFQKNLSAQSRLKLRTELGLEKDDFVMIFPAELSANKRQAWLIEVLAELFRSNKKIHLLLPGKDKTRGRYKQLVEDLGLSKQVHFLGFRKDIPQLFQISDLALSSARREGLPVNLIEAAYSGLPIIASDCRGNRDVAKNAGGRIVAKKDQSGFLVAVEEASKTGRPLSTNKAIDQYSLVEVQKKMDKIYMGAKGCSSISIIVPVYNTEKFVGGCIDSIISQSQDAHLEIIIVNDGSTDNSAKICQEYADKYEFVKLLDQNNRGVSAARNNGLRKALGDYVYFVDSDDKLLPNAIANVQEALQFDPDIITGDFIRFSNNIDLRSSQNLSSEPVVTDILYNPEDLFKRKKYNLSLCTNIIRRDMLTRNKLILNEQVKFTEDLDYTLSVLLLSKKIAVLNTPIYGYRQNSQSATAKISKKTVTDITNFVDKWGQYINKIDNNELRAGIADFLAYEVLIASGMASMLKHPAPEKIIKERIGLFRYNRGAKVRIGLFCYKLFGARATVMLMGKYLKLKGIRC